jgi:threonine/homoserine/homoserine lactone efflux protein
MIDAMLAFAVVAAVVTLTPGLDTMLVLRTAAASGRAPALAAGAGIAIGCLFWAMASALGITALLTASRLAYDVLRWAGAAYLCWLGGRALWVARRRRVASGQPLEAGGQPLEASGRPPTGVGRTASEIAVPDGGSRAAFRIGLTTNLLNPKVGVFYLSMLPQFLPGDVNPLLASIVLAVIHDVEGMAWFVLLALAVQRAGGLLARPAVRRRLDQLTGLVFVGFGLRLAVEGGRR